LDYAPGCASPVMLFSIRRPLNYRPAVDSAGTSSSVVPASDRNPRGLTCINPFGTAAQQLAFHPAQRVALLLAAYGIQRSGPLFSRLAMRYLLGLLAPSRLWVGDASAVFLMAAKTSSDDGAAGF